MNNIYSITEKEIRERFYLAPESIKNALQDNFNVEGIRAICAQENITENEAVQVIINLSAFVFLGFIHADELAEIISEELDLQKETAEDISLKIKSGIFAPFMPEIQTAYSPKIDNSEVAPTPVNPMAIPVPMSIPTAPTAIATPAVSTAPTATSAPAPFASPRPNPIVNTAASAPASAPSINQPKPAPFMMHQESSASPITAGSGFKLNISKDIFKSPVPAKQVDIPKPPKPANIEIGKAPLPPKPSGPVSFKTVSRPQSRIVHYTDLKSGIPPAFGENRPASQPEIKPAETPKPPTPTDKPIMPLIMPKVVNFGPEEVK